MSFKDYTGAEVLSVEPGLVFTSDAGTPTVDSFAIALSPVGAFPPAIEATLNASVAGLPGTSGAIARAYVAIVRDGSSEPTPATMVASGRLLTRRGFPDESGWSASRAFEGLVQGVLYRGWAMAIDRFGNESAVFASSPATLKTPEMQSFLSAGSLDPRVAFSRATQATVVNAKGLIEIVSPGVPRFDHDPDTLAPKGLLVEEERTNLLKHSENYAAWTPFGTTSLTPGAAEAPDGSSRADAIEFSSAFSGLYQSVPGSASSTYVFSIYVRSAGVPGGKVRIVLNTNMLDPTIVEETVGATWRRISVSKTAAPGTTQVSAQIQDTGSGGSRVYLWGAQLEVGSFATSYIPTGSGPATRSPDVAMLSGPNLTSWYRPDEGTFGVRFRTHYSGASDKHRSLIAADGDPVKRFVYLQGGTAEAATDDGNQVLNARGAATGRSVKVFMSYAIASAVSSAVSAVGSPTPSSPPGRTISTGGNEAAAGPVAAGFSDVSSLSIGSGGTGPSGQGSSADAFCGWIESLVYYPSRLPSASLETLSRSPPTVSGFAIAADAASLSPPSVTATVSASGDAEIATVHVAVSRYMATRPSYAEVKAYGAAVALSSAPDGSSATRVFADLTRGTSYYGWAVATDVFGNVSEVVPSAPAFAVAA